MNVIRIVVRLRRNRYDDVAFRHPDGGGDRLRNIGNVFQYFQQGYDVETAVRKRLFANVFEFRAKAAESAVGKFVQKRCPIIQQIDRRYVDVWKLLNKGN